MPSVPYHIAKQIFRYLRDDLSPDEEQAFLSTLEENPSYKATLESFRNGEQVKRELDFIHGLDTDEAWKKVNPDPVKKVSRRPGWWVAAAAIVMLMLSGFWIWRYQQPDIAGLKSGQYANDVLPASDKAQLILSDGRAIALQENQQHLTEVDGTAIRGDQGVLTYVSEEQNAETPPIYNTLKVPKSGTFRLVLPDGSAVWLNANSELRFPLHFSRDERRIYLKGEAYFEIAKDASRPFRVEAGDTQVEVLGTHFNVRTYDQEVATTLVEGSVKVRHADQMVLLVPGQQARSSENDIEIKEGNMAKALAWKENMFYFKEDRISDIMEEISRWYDVEVEYSGSIPNQRYTGSIRRSAKLSEVLDLISFTSSVEFEISGRRVSMEF